MTMRAVAADVPVIMVVEDERITALDLKRRLESFGYHVPPIASTGAEAILRAAETRPDLILMDIMLKGPIDGITAAQQIRLTCDIPTVFLTAYSDEATIERAKETQPLGYLLKPFEEGSLRSTIEIALNNRALQRHLRSSEESLRRQNQYFNSMHELALSLLNRLDLEPLLESIVLRTAELVGAPIGFIDLLLPNQVVLAGQLENDTFVWLGEQHPQMCGDVLRTVWRSGQPILVDDYQTWSQQAEQSPKHIHAIIAVPLKAGQRVIGVLGLVQSEVGKSFTVTQLEVIARFAGLAAIALDHAQLYQAAQDELAERRRAEEAAASLAAQRERLIDVSRLVLSSLDLAEIHRRVRELLSEMLDYEYLSIYQLNTAQQTLELIFSSDAEPEHYPNYTMPSNQGIIGSVVRSGVAEWVNDAQHDPRSFYFEGTQINKDHMICVPLMAQGRTFGVFVVGRKHDPGFTNDEFDLVQPFVAYVALAMEHAQLYASIRDELRARQEAQAALQESERRLRLIAENTTDLILAYDMDQQLVYVNPAVVRMLGYSISELHAMQMLRHHPNDEPLMKRMWKKIFEGRRFSEVESRLLTKDGEFVWVQASWGPLYDEAGHQVGVRGAIRDITQHKRAEQLQSLQLAVTRITAESRSRAEATPRFLQAICINAGWQVGELWRVDSDLQTLIWESAWHVSSAAAKAFVEAGETMQLAEGEVTYRAWKADQFVWVTNIDQPTNSERAALAEAAGLRDAIALPIRAGNVLAILAFYNTTISPRDPDLRTTLESISSQIGQFMERMRAEGQLRQYAQQLMDAQEQERARIARELHDEIGQALALIKMNVRAVQRLAQTTELAPRLSQSLGIIEETLQRVRTLALDLRPSMLDDLGLAATLQWYVERQGEWADWDIEVRSQLDGARLPLDLETACFRVAQEALHNIVRHAQAQHVTIDLWQDQQTLHMRIRDDGIGFDVRAAQERAARGSSGGLLGMRERVALAGGSLMIDSTPNMGTSLWVRLPLPSLDDQPKS